MKKIIAIAVLSIIIASTTVNASDYTLVEIEDIQVKDILYRLPCTIEWNDMWKPVEGYTAEENSDLIYAVCNTDSDGEVLKIVVYPHKKDSKGKELIGVITKDDRAAADSTDEWDISYLGRPGTAYSYYSIPGDISFNYSINTGDRQLDFIYQYPFTTAPDAHFQEFSDLMASIKFDD